MNNIQQFLVEEKERFYADSKEFGFSINKADWLENHDTRLINFILSEVEREVEKKLQSNEFWKQTFPQEYVEGYGIATDDISTIINNLRVK